MEFVIFICFLKAYLLALAYCDDHTDCLARRHSDE